MAQYAAAGLCAEIHGGYAKIANPTVTSIKPGPIVLSAVSPVPGIYWAARAVHSESHWEPHVGRQAVAQTVRDRWEANPHMTLEQIARHPGAFAIARNRYGCADCLRAAREVIEYGHSPIPGYVILHFRNVPHQRDWFAPYVTTIYNHRFYGWPRSWVHGTGN